MNALNTNVLRFTLASATIALGPWLLSPGSAQAVPTTPSLPPAIEPFADAIVPLPEAPISEDVAQLLYPPVSSSAQGLMVLGQGLVSVPADVAEIEMTVYGSDPYAYYDYGWEEDGSVAAPTEPTVDSLTEADLRPVINSIIAAGVPADAVEFDITPGSSASYPSSDSATITINLRNPTQERVEDVVDAATAAISEYSLYSDGSTYVNYSVDSCAALVQQAYTAAIQDAQSRAQSMASALGVEVENVPSVAESPFNLFYPPCSEDGEVSPTNNFFGYGSYGTYYDPSLPAEVQFQRDIFVTFPIRD